MYLKRRTVGKWRPFFLGLNVLKGSTKVVPYDELIIQINSNYVNYISICNNDNDDNINDDSDGDDGLIMIKMSQM